MLASFDFGGSVLAVDFGGSERGGVDFFKESGVLFSFFTGGCLVSMRSMSGDQTFEFLATHIQNDALILISPKFLAEANARLLQNRNLLRQVVTDLEQYPLKQQCDLETCNHRLDQQRLSNHLKDVKCQLVLTLSGFCKLQLSQKKLYLCT